ncbi:MAG: NAD-dependent epimerase/dehydratase family protein [Thiohalocapsa sp.]|jgi:GDP-L-fucose synthase|uniref:NAD-dependent epimerase/dehydratase family protein n=1 Tax=Thiohalocapsa sp. TaxID=2497641 RepID=UPI0025F3E2AC|nr:NAD-dependent epimerase/dehydratase family protein [Thiohalocapsa sp.]MCG6941448.1 NAD-dependent epimerase/dehydratase family protein [Thiohalocapsa sp.]
MIDLSTSKVLITGVNDMIGLHVLTALKRRGAKVLGIGELGSDLGSLRYLDNQIEHFRPDVVFFIPSDRHGIAVHRRYPGTVYYDSMIVCSHLLEAARKAGVRKVVNVMSNCVYPFNAPIPHREEDIWTGLPEESLIPHAMARRLSLVQAGAYAQQFGMQTASLVLASVFGPHDNFDPATAQVAASMINRFVTAAREDREQVVCWGSGRPTRELIYVDDAVHGILAAAIYYESAEPLNIGTGVEVSIRELTEVVARRAGYAGKVTWDTSKPDGRARVCLDNARMRAELPSWQMRSLDEGMAQTVRWFVDSDHRTAGH